MDNDSKACQIFQLRLINIDLMNFLTPNVQIQKF